MAFTLTPVVAKDGNATLIGGGLLAADVAGGGVGPFFLFHGLVDGVAGVNKAQITATNALKVDGSAVTQPVSLASTTITGTVSVTQSGAWSLSANQSVNVAQINGVAPLMGNGATGTGSQRVTIASDQTAFSVNATLQASASTAIGKVDPNTIGTWGLQVATQNSATPTNGELVLGQFNTTPATITSGNVSPLQMDNLGNLLTKITNANANGSALQANSAPVTQAPTSFRVAVVPTVTASAYTAGNVLGGIMTFANILLGSPNSLPTKWSAVLESISVKFKAAAVTGEIDVAIFTANPSGGTYTDKTGPTAAAADQAKLVGIYSLPTPMSNLGTMTVYNLDGIGAVIDGASTSLFAVVTVKGTPTPASTTDVIVELGVLQG